MSTVDDYLITVTPSQKAVFEHIRAVVTRVVPDVEEGTSYAMPAYLYRSKPFLSAMATKKHLSLYPYSGKVIDKLREALHQFELTSGSIHFAEDRPVPDDLLERIINCRLQEIDEQAAKSKR